MELYLGNTSRDGPKKPDGSSSMKLMLDTEWALHAQTNQKITQLLWLPLLPLLSWYQSSLVFWAQALWVPCLLARGAERQVASRTLHRHRHSWLAWPNVAHRLAVSRRAPCSLGVQVDFWNTTEAEINRSYGPLLIPVTRLGMQDPVLHGHGEVEALCTCAHGLLRLLFFSGRSEMVFCNSSCTGSITITATHYKGHILCLYRRVQKMKTTNAFWEACTILSFTCGNHVTSLM